MKNVYSACLRPVFLLCLLTTVAVAQPSERIVKVNVAPEKAGWTYKTGENIRFAVSVTQWGQALKGVKVR
ncbi:MAG: hypothetical protein J7576_19490, partial [Siphonobacter aquaeclarae]|nr:hypothetical protein [Siphonobacter aquaeclarae]